MSAEVTVCDGGTAEWLARQIDCLRCHGRWTFFGRSQAWYDTDWVCSHCGAQASADGWRWGSPRRDRERALRRRALFAAWLIAGSPSWRSEMFA